MSWRVDRLASLGWILGVGSIAFAQNTPADLPAVKQAMERAVSQQEIAGAVTVVATPEGIAHLDCTGLADVASQRPMEPETIFWIASMTKPITAASILMLEDEGKLSVDDPVSKYIPEYARLHDQAGKPVKVTLRHLLTHTAGLTELSVDESRPLTELSQLIPIIVSRPVSFEPGTKWAYSQTAINTLGRIVEVCSGQPFATFVEERLFVPLGMKDTTFYLSEPQLGRLAKSYERTEAGQLKEAANWILMGKTPTSRDRFPAANGGLFSTATDYARFARMLLNGGELDGKRYLKAETVARMTSVQTPDLVTGFTPGNGWGLGVCVVRKPEGVSAMLHPGSFGHGGAYGTQVWIDPVAKRAYILMVQRSNFPNSDASDVRKAFQQAAVDALSNP